MGWYSKAKKSVSNVYKRVDSAVGGVLPGGVPRSSSSTPSSSNSGSTSTGGGGTSSPTSSPSTSGGSSGGSGGSGSSGSQTTTFRNPDGTTGTMTITKIGAENIGGIVSRDYVGGGGSTTTYSPSGVVTSSHSGARPINSPQSQIAKDTPNSYSTAPYTPTPTKDIPNFFMANVRNNPLTAVGGSLAMAGNNIKDFSVNAWNKLSDKEKRDEVIKQQEMDLRSGTRYTPFTQSGKGTMVREDKQYTNEEIVNLGASGQF